MRSVFYIAVLSCNYVKSSIQSGIDTAILIIKGPRFVNSGTTTFPYGNLTPKSACVLAALVTLTPGTTTIEIDLEQREFLLHILDMGQREATLTKIRKDFVAPLLGIQGAKQ